MALSVPGHPRGGILRASVTGPANRAGSERSIRGFVYRSGELGFPVTFFVNPEVAVEQAGLFGELRQRGCLVEVLHLHLRKFRAGDSRSHVGGPGESGMRAILCEAVSMWQPGMGCRAVTFSANGLMYRVPADLVCRGGPCSLPGRVRQRMSAAWTGAAPDPHRAHAPSRQLAGGLPFANVTVSADFSRVRAAAGIRRQEANYETSAAHNTQSVHQRGATIPVMDCIMHNDGDLSDPGDRVLRNLLRARQAKANGAGMTPVGATIEAIVDVVLAEPDRSLAFIHT